MGTLMRLNQLDVKQWAMVGTAGVLVVLVLMLMVWKNPTPLVVVDMTRAVQSPSLMLARSKLTPDAQLKIMSRFSTLLPKIVKEYGQKHQVTVVSAAILASHNNVDVTNEIIALTIARMKHEG